MGTRDIRIACNRGTFVKTSVQTIPMVKAEPCAFVLEAAQYGDSSAIRGKCIVHAGGKIVISMRVTMPKPKWRLLQGAQSDRKPEGEK